MKACLEAAAHEIDARPADYEAAHTPAFTVRHVVEQQCSDILRRFARAYEPFPLSMERESSQRYSELDLYLRQSHAERNLEALGSQLFQIKRQKIIERVKPGFTLRSYPGPSEQKAKGIQSAHVSATYRRTST